MKRFVLSVALWLMVVVGFGFLVLGAACLALVEGEMQKIPAEMTGIPVHTAILDTIQPEGTLMVSTVAAETPEPGDVWVYATIPAGEVQITPGDSECRTAPSGWINYIVTEQDNIMHLSVLFGISVPAIQAANCMEGLEIHPGQTIFLPFSPALATVEAATPLPPTRMTDVPLETAMFSQPTIISSRTETPLAP